MVIADPSYAKKIPAGGSIVKWMVSLDPYLKVVELMKFLTYRLSLHRREVPWERECISKRQEIQ